jgi:hypothetical protein
LDYFSMTPLDIALDYIRRGWSPVPVHFKSKKPKGEGWQHIRATADNAAQYFNGAPMNTGVLLGFPSNKLCDVDLDCAEARAIAAYILQKTDAIFGRASSRNSHRLYYSDLVDSLDVPKGVINLDDPRKKGDEARLLELRIGGKHADGDNKGKDKGCQSVFPGSVHESGEEIKWEVNGEPATADGNDLIREVRAVGAYCLLARYWPPPKSGHHDAALVVGGFLARCGNHPAIVRSIVTAIAKAMPGCREEDIVRSAKDAAEEYTKGGHAYGYPELARTFSEDIARKVAEWLDYSGGWDAAPQGAERGADQKPSIQLVAGKLHTIADAAEQALIDAGLPIYVHGEQLQRPVVDEVEASRGRRTHVARFASVNADTMRDLLSRAVNWLKYNERKKSWTPADPPRDIALTILNRAGEWRFLPAAGVISTPTLRPDGSILDTPGYDPATRLILMHPPAMPDIPAAPNMDDAKGALVLLDNLLAEFPFVDEASHSVALSELITPVVRGAMPVAPLHANRAPVAGTGKSHLVDIASAIVNGQPCPVISAGADEFELEKRLGAAMLRGQSMISIDNLNGELRGDFLCQMIERPIIKVRPLGVSNLVHIESKARLYATGNNIVLVGDVVRRVLLCSLDPEMERPELRTFRQNPLERVLIDRGRYIAAALVIVRAYLAAGCPGELPPLASFGDWSRLVRSPLVWLGRTDPVDTMETAREEDPELDSIRRIYQTWHDSLGVTPYTAGKIIEIAEDKDYNSQKPTYPEFHDALMDVAWSAGSLSAKKLARWLKRYQNRIVGDLQLASQYDGHAKVHCWRVRPPVTRRA